MNKNLLNLSFAGFLLFSTQVIADSIPKIVETDWIKPTAGQVDSRLGARIIAVEPTVGSEAVTVQISMPDTENAIEEVTVLGRPEAQEMEPVKVQQPSKVEVLNSPERSGIIIHLPKLQDFVLQINYSEAPQQP